jgi:hypothetical protein
MTTSTAEPTRDWCASMCNSYRRCEAPVSSECVASCLDANAAYLARRTGPALEFEMQCMSSAVCTEDFDDLMASCFSDSLTALEPTGEAEQLCDDLASEFFACSWFPSHASCARFHAGYSALALASEQGCASLPCEDLDACIEARLYRYGE